MKSRKRKLGPDFAGEKDPVKKGEITLRWKGEQVAKGVEAYDPGSWNDKQKLVKGIPAGLPGDVVDRILEGREAKRKAWKKAQAGKVEPLTRKEQWTQGVEAGKSLLPLSDPLRIIDERETDRVKMYPDAIPIAAKDIRSLFTLLSEGKSVSASLREVGLSRNRFHEALARHPEAAREYEAIRLVRADIMADEVVDIADLAGPENAEIAQATLRINARKWTAQMLHPKRYSEKLQVDQEIKHSVSDLKDVPTEVLERMMNEITKYKAGAVGSTLDPLKPGETQLLPASSRDR